MAYSGWESCFGHSFEAARHRHAHGQIEHALGQLHQAAQVRSAAGQHSPAGIMRVQSAALQFVANQREQFLRARLDNFVQHARENGARRTVADAGDLDGAIFHDQILKHAAVLALDFFGLGNRRAQADGQIVGEMIAAHRNGRRMAHHAVAEDDQLRRAAADIEQAAAQFALILREAGFGRSQRLEHRVRDSTPARFTAVTIFCVAEADAVTR